MMSACPREKSHILASPVAGEEVVLSPLLLCSALLCSPVCPSVQIERRAEQSSHCI